jgi:4-hydroxybenzoate polyprenyltransferase
MTSKVAHFARLIKVEHSIYALPFAYAGALLAELRVPSWQALAWITLAMVAARSAAMALNRVVDAGIDARNPRTAGREIPSGKLRKWEVWLFIVASLGLLILAAFFLSPPCRYLWPIPVAAFVVYPYTKRYTWACHYVLGLTDGLAPAAAWLAVSGRMGLAPVLLFLAVGAWVGGFDVIYGVFDLDVDRAQGLHSLAAAFGERAALRTAACSHLVAVGLLLWVGMNLGLGVAYDAGLAVVALVLAWSHVDIARRGLSRVGMAFMTVNGVVSLVYFAAVLAAVLNR